MNFKSLALAVGIAASSLTSAFAATPIDALLLSYKQDGEFSTKVTTSEGFWSALVSAFNTNGYTAVYNSFLGLASDLDDYDWTSVAFVAKKTDAGATTWTGNLSFNTTSQSISFASGNLVGGTLQANPTVAVPGPEAGAGLGALAMGGMAFWVARRRKEQKALAA